MSLNNNALRNQRRTQVTLLDDQQVSVNSPIFSPNQESELPETEI
jgi:hypothetical protein